MTGLDPSWEFYRSFLAVLTEGSLSSAARRLGLSQPTVGRHIEALEHALGGVVLFTRSQKGFAPTDAALEMEPHVRAMAFASEAMVRAASAEAVEARGVVRITASEVIGAEVLPALLRDFREVHSGVIVELALANHTEDLLRREADIAVRMVQPTQGALLSQKIGSVKLGFYAHRRYVERHGVPATIPEFLQRPLIGFDRRPSISLSAASDEVAVTRDLFALRADNDLAGLAALRAGFGIGVCQEPLAARDPDLLPVGLDILHLSLSIWLVMHEDLKGVRRMRLMFDHLVEGLCAYVAG